MQGRVVVGRDSGQTEFDTLGETGGAKTHTLTAAESGLPAHTHNLNQTVYTTNTGGLSGFGLTSVTTGSAGSVLSASANT